MSTDIAARKHPRGGSAVLESIARVLSAAAILDDALPPLLQEVCSFLGWDIGAFWMMDPATEALACRCFYSASRTHVPTFELVTRELTVTPGDDLIGRAWADGALVWIGDVSAHPSFTRRLAARRDGLRTGFALPILTAGAPRAVMEYYSGRLPRLTADTWPILSIISTAIGLFLARVEADQALHDSESRGSFVLSHAPVVLLSLDHNGLITLSEGRALQSLGLMPGESVGRSIFDVYRDHPEILACVRRALAGEAITAMIHIGTIIFETHFSPQHVAGHVVGVSGVATVFDARRSMRRQQA